MNPSTKMLYINTWMHLLTSVAGWTRTEVQDWIRKKQYDVELDDSNSLLYHKQPLYWMVDEVIPRDLKEKLTVRERMLLYKDIFKQFKELFPTEFPVSGDTREFK